MFWLIVAFVVVLAVAWGLILAFRLQRRRVPPVAVLESREPREAVRERMKRR